MASQSKMASRSNDAADYQAVPRPAAAMPKPFSDGHVIPLHRHARAQLLFAVRGTMTVRTEGRAWMVPQQRALWVPPEVLHQVRMIGDVAMRTLYIAPASAAAMPAQCAVLAVTPLARELIARATDLPLEYDEAGHDGVLMRLLLLELHTLETLPLSLPYPASPGLAAHCETWLADIGAMPDADACAQACAVSTRTLARRFINETGLTLGQWRQQARLLEAIRRLHDGASVTDIALTLGYDSPSAFSAMFRRLTGTTPRAMQQA